MIKIIIFGCSIRAEKLEQICKNIPEIDILGYSDSDINKWNTKYLGRNVYTIQDMQRICIKYPDVKILAMPKYYVSVIKQLKRLGFKHIYSCIYEILEEAGLKTKYVEQFCLSRDSVDKSKNKILLIGGSGLPKQEELYRSGFIFRRLVEYRKAKLQIDAYGYIDSQYWLNYIYDGEMLIEGGENGLVFLLTHNHYEKVLLHFPSAELIYLCNKYLSKTTQLICWLHGYDILHWKRRKFNYTEKEIIKKGKELDEKSEEKMVFFRELFIRKNTSFIFVSHWLKEVSKEDIGFLPQKYEIIPNYIDQELFSYKEKLSNSRFKLLLIKSNITRMYANDIAAKVILLLSEKDFFKNLKIEIYGDGKLFEENYQEVIDKNFPNVHVHKYYLPQTQIAQLHKEYGIFLCPTRQDTQGVSMCEAMNSGMVVVTNCVAAVPEYANKNCCILCDDENVQQMADEIEKLIYNENEFLRYSKNAASYMKERCGYENTISKELKQIRQ